LFVCLVIMCGGREEKWEGIGVISCSIYRMRMRMEGHSFDILVAAQLGLGSY
jgi:hypothetical protein